MEKILVGIDGSERSQRALDWASALAASAQAKMTLCAVIDPASVRMVGSDEEILQSAVDAALEAARKRAEENDSELCVDTLVCRGDVVESLLANAEGYDLAVVGSHHNKTVGEKIFGAKGLRIASSSASATAVVPSDYDIHRTGSGIVVGVGPDDASNDAVILGVNMALLFKEPLILVSAWGVPTLLARSAEVMGGGLQPVGEMFQRKLDALIVQIRTAYPQIEVTGSTVEGSSPAQVVIDQSRDKRMLLLGTRPRSRVSRALFGSVTFGVLSRLEVPVIVVPEKNGE